MQKKTYIAPVVEITTWKQEDVITTSGVVANTAGVVSTLGDSNVTVSVKYEDLH